MSKVVPFSGSIVPGEPDPDIIEVVEDLLDEAKSGKLRGIAFGAVKTGNALSTGWVGSDGTRDSLSTSVTLLHHRFVATILEGNEDD